MINVIYLSVNKPNMKKLYTLIVLATALILTSCSRESDESTALSDEALITVVKQTDVLDVGSSIARMKSQDFRIRMNAVAKNSLSAEGNMSVTYAVNSMLVKEYLNSKGDVTGYDVMYKAPADPNSSGGWLWASYDQDGHPTYGVNMRGATCNSCHGKSNTLVLDEKK